MWEILQRNWWLVFVAVAYGVSAIANALQRAAAKQRRESRQADRERRAETGEMAGPVPAGPRRERDLAEEIRQMMGLDLEPAVEEIEEPEPEPQFETVPEPRRSSVDGIEHGGDLESRLALREAERVARSRSSIEDRGKDFGSAISSRYAPEVPEPSRRERRRPVPRFDRNNARDAIIALEVFGPPRGLDPRGTRVD